jgi:hypothetical protein
LVNISKLRYTWSQTFGTYDNESAIKVNAITFVIQTPIGQFNIGNSSYLAWFRPHFHFFPNWVGISAVIGLVIGIICYEAL